MDKKLNFVEMAVKSILYKTMRDEENTPKILEVLLIHNSTK